MDATAALIEVLADQPLGTFLKERLFTPLGMPDTAFGVPAHSVDRLAAMYGGPDVLAAGQTIAAIADAWDNRNDLRRDVTATYPTDVADRFARGGYGLCSTAADYTRFARMLLTGGHLDSTQILQPATTQLMHRNHLPDELLPFENDGRPVHGYGFGLGSSVLTNIDAAGGSGSLGEHGWPGAATTLFWVDPELQLTVTLTAQSMMRLDDTEADLKATIHHTISAPTTN